MHSTYSSGPGPHSSSLVILSVFFILLLFHFYLPDLLKAGQQLSMCNYSGSLPSLRQAPNCLDKNWPPLLSALPCWLSYDMCPTFHTTPAAKLQPKYRLFTLLAVELLTSGPLPKILGTMQLFFFSTHLICKTAFESFLVVVGVAYVVFSTHRHFFTLTFAAAEIRGSLSMIFPLSSAAVSGAWIMCVTLVSALQCTWLSVTTNPHMFSLVQAKELLL